MSMISVDHLESRCGRWFRLPGCRWVHVLFKVPKRVECVHTRFLPDVSNHTTCVFQEMERDRQRQLGKSLIGGPWELVNHDGKLTNEQDYLGKWTFIYFGFTHCPDVCPDEIEKMVQVLDKLGTNFQNTINV